MKGRDRNSPCHCGSGKKYKKCCFKKTKLRTTSIVAKFKEPLDLTKKGLQIFFKNDNVSMFVDGERISHDKAWIEVGYDRAKGKKVLNYIPNIDNNIVGNANFALNNYDLIYAIDTNTKKIKDSLVSICCVISCKTSFENEKVFGSINSIQLFEFRNLKCPIENYVWEFFIKNIIKDINNIKLGIIVDSDLDKITRYNNGELPINIEYFLPKNINLIYASADVGKEFIINKYISLCDREAKKLLDYIEHNWEDLCEWPEEDVSPNYLFKVWFRK
jgi:hypothetical protein